MELIEENKSVKEEQTNEMKVGEDRSLPPEKDGLDPYYQ